MRFDFGYWSNETTRLLGKLGVRYSMAIRAGTKAVKQVMEEIGRRPGQRSTVPLAAKPRWRRPPTRAAGWWCTLPG